VIVVVVDDEVRVDVSDDRFRRYHAWTEDEPFAALLTHERDQRYEKHRCRVYDRSPLSYALRIALT